MVPSFRFELHSPHFNHEDEIEQEAEAFDFENILLMKEQPVVKQHDHHSNSIRTVETSDDTNSTFSTSTADHDEYQNSLSSPLSFHDDAVSRQHNSSKSSRRGGGRHRSSILYTQTAVGSSRDMIDSMLSKSVRFDMSRNITFEHDDQEIMTMTEQECQNYWYSRTEIESFQDTYNKVKQALFEQPKQGVSWWNMMGKGVDVQKTLRHAYSTCGQARSDKSMSKAGNLLQMVLGDILKQMYAQRKDTVTGLEYHLLQQCQDRNAPADLCRFILDQSHQQQILRSHGSWENALAYTSACVSRPSRILAHELAKAQHQAVLLH